MQCLDFMICGDVVRRYVATHCRRVSNLVRIPDAVANSMEFITHFIHSLCAASILLLLNMDGPMVIHTWLASHRITQSTLQYLMFGLFTGRQGSKEMRRKSGKWKILSIISCA